MDLMCRSRVCGAGEPLQPAASPPADQAPAPTTTAKPAQQLVGSLTPLACC